MNLEKHEQALIKTYRQASRIKKQLIWLLLHDDMKQKGRRIFFN